MNRDALIALLLSAAFAIGYLVTMPHTQPSCRNTINQTRC